MFSTAKHKHHQQFQDKGKAINDKVRLYAKVGHALLDAKESESDPFEAIEKVISWEDFMLSITEADQLSQPESFDHLHLVTESFNMLRRYTPEFLHVLQLNAAPAAQRVLDAITVIRGMNARGSRKMPEGAPTTFVKPRWKPLVIVNGSIDPRLYEICALSELKNSLRSGDIWVSGSRQFRNFDEYLLPSEKFVQIRESNELPIAVTPNCEEYLSKRLHQLEQQLATVSELALSNELPNAIITDTGLKITQLETFVPDGAQRLIDQTSALLPRIKITELLMEVDDWTGFTRHFVHLKDGNPAPDRTLLLSAILADAINLGLTKMAESSPGLTYDKLSWLQAWHIRDETYSAGLADLVNAQFHHNFANNWGDGTTSSSDGQRFRASSKAQSTGHVNPEYGSEPGRKFYTHISDQYAPFSTRVVNVGIRDSTYVLDDHWDEILRLATSIKQGTVTASLMMRKLGAGRVTRHASYPRQNGLSIALRELGRIERTLFILDWLQNVELRRRVHAGLNKGKARNALARAVFFNRLGEIRDRSFDQQSYRASGLNLVTAAIVLWNTVYIERAI